MNDNDWLWVIVAGVAIWWFLLRQPTSQQAAASSTAAGATTALTSLTVGAPSPAAAVNGSSPNLAQQLESSAAGVTHVPLGAVGAAAQAAPLWAKIGIFPIGVTALTQSIINNPVGAAKSVGSFTATAAKDTAHVTVTAAKGVASAAKTAAGGIATGAKAATSAVENVGKKVLSFL
jgi:hypothetical protein